MNEFDDLCSFEFQRLTLHYQKIEKRRVTFIQFHRYLLLFLQSSILVSFLHNVEYPLVNEYIHFQHHLFSIFDHCDVSS